MKEYFLIKLLISVVFRGKGILFEKFSQFFHVYIPLTGGNRGYIIRPTTDLLTCDLFITNMMNMSIISLS